MAFAQLADEDLMQLVRRGDAQAFEVVYDRHATAAFSLAYRMTGTRNTAEDVVQEAFLSLWRSGARYDRTRGSVRTWVLGIVHNRAIDALRRSMVHDRRRASDEGIEERFEARERTDVEAARRDEARDVRQALGTLPAEQCKVIELAYFGGFTHSEIASHARHAHRDREGPHAPRPREAARPARRPGGGDVMSACAHRDDVGSYVLRALPDDEHERFEAHLATCEDCRREVAELQVAADTLPLAAVQVAPPPELRDRIMAIVRSEAELLNAAEARADEPRRDAGRQARRGAGGAGRLSLRPLPAALAAAPSSPPAWSAASCSSGGHDTQHRAPATVQHRLGPGARASLQLSDDATKLEVRRMPPPPAARSTRCGSSARTRTRRPRRRSSAPTPTAAPTSRSSAGA